MSLSAAGRSVLLKLSGEVLAGPSRTGLDPATLDATAEQLVRAVAMGAKVAVVQGGGNIFRGLGQAARDMDRVSADQMGMLATVINGLALCDAVRRKGGQAQLYTAFSIGPVGRLYVRDAARQDLRSGNVVILSGGTGNPFFSTDSAAALRAAELGCEVFLKGTKVDGVYDDDPEKNPAARRFDTLTLDELIERRLRIIDLTAATLCRENGIDVRVYRMTEADSIYRAATGEPLGTLVRAR
ncbi:MAG: UMP kinase [Myxococcota bacterium]|jgi:uridylate kinase|nr:UMP kinase [Myxococcota bacterium]